MKYNLEDYNYNLPEGLIARFPVHPRDHSRLMVIHIKSGLIEHRRFYELPEIIAKYYVDRTPVFVSNNTLVMPARLIGKRETGGRVEVLLLRKIEGHIWECMIQMTARAVAQISIQFQLPESKSSIMSAKIIKGSSESSEGLVWVEFDRDPIQSGVGQLPLPPYMQRNADTDDAKSYQTIYSKEIGSVAAPTAGLHFTSELIAKLLAIGCDWEEITLHVGMGTFRPVKVSDIREHKMHSEFFKVNTDTKNKILNALNRKRPIVAVGTTSLRSLESMGLAGSERAKNIVSSQHSENTATSTDIFIYENNQIRSVSALITNFHLPKSSLLILVSAFAGYDLIQEAYKQAIALEYRFYSYGDAMILT